jgi:hypothetical protein
MWRSYTSLKSTEISANSLLVLKALPREPVASPPALILHDAIPINSKFDIGMAQQPSSTIDLGGKSIGSSKTGTARLFSSTDSI